MGHRAELRLELLDDVVLSRRAATVGEHQSLDYIPGSTLLGWAASRLYKQLSMEQAFQIFHSGHFRFGNGLPANGNSEIARPMPLCWHEDKGGDAALSDDRLCPDRLFHLGFGKPDGLKQPRQLRDGYVVASGEVLSPLKAHRMRTAIDASTGTAAESQLFGFESLQRGQRFVAQITADDVVPAELFSRVLQTFCETIRIGRSRSAQYGRVRVSVESVAAAPADRVTGRRSLTLWLQSDMALRDSDGMPILVPDNSALLGLTPGTLDLRKSFVRFRSYAPYNAHHKCYESDRQVIVAGSILHFDLEQALTEKDAALLEAGIGSHREAGLGAVCANHVWMESARPEFSAATILNVSPAVEPSHPLITLLKIRAGQHSIEKEAKDWAAGKRDVLAAIYLSARHYNGVHVNDAAGPNRAQWRRVQEVVMQQDGQKMFRDLFDPKDGICKPNDPEWSLEYEAGHSFAEWLRLVVEEISGQAHCSLRLQWLGRYAESLSEPALKRSEAA